MLVTDINKKVIEVVNAKFGRGLADQLTSRFIEGFIEGYTEDFSKAYVNQFSQEFEEEFTRRLKEKNNKDKVAPDSI